MSFLSFEHSTFVLIPATQGSAEKIGPSINPESTKQTNKKSNGIFMEMENLVLKSKTLKSLVIKYQNESTTNIFRLVSKC